MTHASTPRPRRLARAAAMLTLAVSAVAGGAAHAAGIDIHKDASAADVGLPAYPGAVRKPPGQDDDGGGVSLGLWGGSFGLKLVAVGYTSSDGVDAVAAFYRDALARYGPVVDCSQNKPRAGHASSGRSIDIDSDKGGDARPVTCGDDAPDAAGGRLYKVGTKADQRLFELRPTRNGVSFDLVHLQLRGGG